MAASENVGDLSLLIDVDCSRENLPSFVLGEEITGASCSLLSSLDKTTADDADEAIVDIATDVVDSLSEITRNQSEQFQRRENKEDIGTSFSQTRMKWGATGQRMEHCLKTEGDEAFKVDYKHYYKRGFIFQCSSFISVERVYLIT